MAIDMLTPQDDFDNCAEEDGFEDWLMSEFEGMIQHALLEDLANFAFGDLVRAVEAWREHKENL